MRDKCKKTVDDNLADMIADPATPLEVKIKLVEMRTNLEANRRQHNHDRMVRRMREKTEKAAERPREKYEDPTIPLGERVSSILAGMAEVKKDEEVTQ